MDASQATHVEWDGKKHPIAQVWDYGPQGDAANARIATLLETSGWEPKWFFTGRGKIKNIYLRCRITGKFFPQQHYSVAPGWVEGMR